jgi:alanyl-tRNA synthetase
MAKEKLGKISELLDDKNIENLTKNAQNFHGYKVIVESFENLSQKDLQNLSAKVVEHSDDAITIFVNETDQGSMIMSMLGSKPSQDSNASISSKRFIMYARDEFNGKGGGRKEYGQGWINKENAETSAIVWFYKDKFSEENQE